jgi:hypothetical protein
MGEIKDINWDEVEPIMLSRARDFWELDWELDLDFFTEFANDLCLWDGQELIEMWEEDL